MNILIELYDRDIPYNNFLLCSILKPDKLLLLTSNGEEDPSGEQFENFRKAFKLHTSPVFRKCDTRDITQTVDCLNEIISEYGEENCVIGTVGGNETMLLAVGICIPEHPGLRVVGIRNTQPVWIWGGEPGAAIHRKTTALSVRDVIAIAAGELISYNPISHKKTNDSFFQMIPPMFGIYMKHRAAWSDFTFYLQKICSEEYKKGETEYSGPAEFLINQGTGKTVKPKIAILDDLISAKIIEYYRTDTEQFTLKYTRPEYISPLCKTGAWLELFVFSAMKRSGLFSDVIVDAVISWDNDEDDDDTVNEVDVIAVKGTVPVFISCKSGVPVANALYEVLAIARRFGNFGAKAVLVTAGKLDREAPAVKKRANDSGIIIIDNKKLNKKDITKAFRKLFPEDA